MQHRLPTVIASSISHWSACVRSKRSLTKEVDMLNEMKFGFRALLKTPGFTAIAIATLALAIGANSAVVSLINALLVRPLPYHDSSRLILLWDQFKALGLERIPLSTPEYVDLERDFHSCSQIAAFN